MEDNRLWSDKDSTKWKKLGNKAVKNSKPQENSKDIDYKTESSNCDLNLPTASFMSSQTQPLWTRWGPKR